MIRFIDEHYAVAPQLHPEHIEQVAAAGFKTLINNRPDHEDPTQPRGADIEALAREAGLHYLFIPVGGGHAPEVSAQVLREALETAPKPILAFCRSGNRSTIVYQIARHAPPPAKG